MQRWYWEKWTWDGTTYSAWNERIESKMILIEMLLCKYSSDYFLSLIFWLIVKCQEITANSMWKKVPEHYGVCLKTGYRATESWSLMQFHLRGSRLFQLIINNIEDWNAFLVSIQNSKIPMARISKQQKLLPSPRKVPFSRKSSCKKQINIPCLTEAFWGYILGNAVMEKVWDAPQRQECQCL